MSLQKPLLTLLILMIASSVSSTTCGSNPLLETFNLTADFANAQFVPGLNYCKSLQNNETCCSAATINNFQARTDALLNRLRSSAAQRDESLIYIRDTLIPSLNGELQVMYQASYQAFMKLMMSPPVNFTVMGAVQYYAQMARGFTDPQSIEIMKDNFTSYQASRTACVINIVKIQAAAWCLACDPEFESKGVSEDGIEFSENLVETLTDSCYYFIDRARILSTYFSFNEISPLLPNITAALNKIAAGDMTGGSELVTIAQATPVVPQDVFYRPVSFPQNCNVFSCQRIATDLFEQGKVDEDALAFGGVIPESTSSRRMLGGKANRVLTQGSWDPDMDEAGVIVTFEDSPQQV